MDATVELTTESEEAVVSGSTALYIPATDPNMSPSPSHGKLPRRLQRRLVESQMLNTTSAQEIQAKLKQADLRRQQFHELMSTKAQLLSSKVLLEPTSTEDKDRGHDAELNAAEKKRCWREFAKLKKTTFALTKAYVDLNINAKSVKLMPFEQLAHQIESPATIQTAKALLEQLETSITRQQTANYTSNPSSLHSIDHLLKSLANIKTIGDQLHRYPVRVVLCAYMILGHVDEVSSEKGECKMALTESVKFFVCAFESLTQIVLLDGPIQTPQEKSASFKTQLKAFDEAWCSYLYQFVSWKVKDATSLDEELVKASCQLELSMMQHTCNQGDYSNLKPDMKAVRKQVIKDQQILREIVQHSSGNAGVKRIESALSSMRSTFLVAKEAVKPNRYAPS